MTRARHTSETARQAKAWVNFDGTFATSPFTEANGGIRDSFNVDSCNRSRHWSLRCKFYEDSLANTRIMLGLDQQETRNSRCVKYDTKLCLELDEDALADKTRTFHC